MERVFDDFPWLVHTPVPELATLKEEVAAILVAEHRAWLARRIRGYNFCTASDHEFFGRLYNRFYFECAAWFERFTLAPDNSRRAYAYVQTGEAGTSKWHDHVRTSSVSGVYYLAVPDAAGQIWFRRKDRIRKVTPQEGHLYLFPRWLTHKPVPQASPDHRISINVELITVENPIARDGTRW